MADPWRQTESAIRGELVASGWTPGGAITVAATVLGGGVCLLDRGSVHGKYGQRW